MSEAERPAHYPVMLDVVGRLSVVVGGGASALRAAASLAKHGADVVVITPDVSVDLQRMEADGLLTVEPRGYVRGDLEGAFLAVVSSGSSETDAAVAAEARERKTLLNVQSDGAASDFIVPSVVVRGDLQIAVSTQGKAPSAAREVRRSIAEAYGPEWGRYVELVGELRTLAVERTGLSDADLAHLFAYVADSDARERIAGGGDVTAEDLYRSYLVSSGDAPADDEGVIA
jgi:precorrin-2 dehydrogenase / sirohydrochlorin ferrochelatase